MTAIPSDYVNYKSTPIFTPENIPKMFLHLHNTRAGVYGKISVLQGQLKFYGFKDRRGDIEQEIIIKAGSTATKLYAITLMNVQFKNNDAIAQAYDYHHLNVKLTQ
jgi:tellurite resistance-related uncharacterized protein